LDDFDDLEILDIMDLSEEQMRQVDANYPGFVEYITGGGLPKEYAVLHMGWIRVNGVDFEVGQLSEKIMDRISDYVHDDTNGDLEIEFAISDRSSGRMEEFTLDELSQALQQGMGVALFRQKSRRPQGLY